MKKDKNNINKNRNGEYNSIAYCGEFNEDDQK